MKDIFEKAWKIIIFIGTILGITISIFITWVAVTAVAICATLL